MYPKQLWFIGLLVWASSSGARAQIKIDSRQIKLSIPLHSELSAVQRLNRDGVDAVQKHHYEKAEGLFYRAYLFDPADPFTLNNLGYIAQVNGEIDRAESFYKLATDLGCYAVIERSSDRSLPGRPMMDALGTLKNLPMRVNRMNMLGMQLLSRGRGFEAVTLFQQAIELQPADPFTLNNLGAAEESIGDFDNALKHYDEAAASHSTEPIVIAFKKSTRGKPVSEVAANSARELRRETKDETPAQIRATMLTIRGISETNRNDWDAARKDFLEAYALEPQGAFTLNNLGYVSERDGDLETARSYYARALRADGAKGRIGATTSASSRGLRLSNVADESHRKVDMEMLDEAEKRRTNSGPVQLIPREGQAPPDPAPGTVSPSQPALTPVPPKQSPQL